MPRGDGTGPAGAGPATGRGLGFCTGFNSPGFTKGAPRGGGGAAGGGRGRSFSRANPGFSPRGTRGGGNFARRPGRGRSGRGRGSARGFR